MNLFAKIKDLLFKRQDNTDDLTQYPNWRVGMSSAASWSWGVSLAAGMAIMMTKGVLPFAIWMTGNILAVPLFGCVRTFSPHSKNWPQFLPFLLLFFFVEFFCILLNLQGLLNGLGGGIDISSFVFLPKEYATWVVIAIGLFIVWYIHKGGLKISVLTDFGQYAIQLSAVIVLAILGYFLGTKNSFELVVINNGVSGLEWARMGFLGVITGALGTGHQWQRFSAIKKENIFRVSLWAGAFFGIYMLFVALTGIFFTKHIVLGVIFLIAMIALGSSSIDSAVAGMEFIAKKLKIKSYYAMIVASLTVVLWPLIIQSGMTSIWTFMAKIRFWGVITFLGLTILVMFIKALRSEKIKKVLIKMRLMLKE